MARHVTELLSELADGGLSGAVRRRVDAHLDGCDECARVLAELREVRARARSLGDAPPRHDLWPAIRRRLNADAGALPASFVSATPARGGPRPRPWARDVRVRVWHLAAAGLALVFVSTAAAGLLRDDGAPRSGGAVPVMAGAAAWPDAPSEHADELAALEAALIRQRGSLDPNTVRILEKNLAVIDRAVQESRAALAVDPGNAYLEEHLARTYRKRVDVLREALAMVRPVS